ncbi:MAG: AI-2E family transporter [Candidatus Dojkabacteria bacterium]
MNSTQRYILYAAVAFVFAVAAYYLRNVLIMLIIAYILDAGLRPTVNRLQRHGVPRWASILSIYSLVMILVVVVAVLTANEFITQSQNLISTTPEIVRNASQFIEEYVPTLAQILPLDTFTEEAEQFAGETGSSGPLEGLFSRDNVLVVLTQAYGLAGGAIELSVQIFAVIMISIYMLLREHKFYEKWIDYIPARRKESLKKTLHRIDTSLGSWILGQIVLMVIIGIATYIIISVPGLFFDGYKLDQYALPIALLVGLLELIPNLGPFTATVITSVLAIGTSGIFAVLYVGITFVALQSAEAVFIVPQVMRKAVGLDPIIVILAIIAGFQIYGILGAILVIPFLATIKIIIGEIIREYYPELVDLS